MKRKRLPPPPPEPPEGKMWFNGELWDIKEFERACRYNFLNQPVPTRRNDPSYDWKEQCQRKKRNP